MNWAAIPFLRLLIPLVAGILLAPIVPAWSAWIIPPLLLAYLISRKWSSRLYPILPLLILSLSIELARPAIPSKPTGQSVVIKLLDEPTYKGKTTRAVADFYGTKLMLYFLSDSLLPIHYGDHLLIENTLDTIPSPKNPAAFDLRSYYHHQDIFYTGFIKKWKALDSSEPNLIKHLALRSRAYFDQVLHQYLRDGQSVAIASALLLGNRSELTPEIRDAYANTGSIHILAVSGLHVGILFILLGFILKPLPSLFRIPLILCGVWFFCLMSGASPSVLRASLMCSLLALGTAFHRPISSYNSLFATAFCLLIADPLLMFSVGFQLSFFAVLGIMGLPIYDLLTIKHRLLDRIWMISAVSIAAQIGTLPLSLYYFGQFPMYFIISNLIAIPAAAGILYAGILLFILSGVNSLAVLVGWFLNLFIGSLNTSVQWIAELPYARIEHIYLDSLSCLLLSVVIFVLALAFIHKRAIFFICGLLLSCVLAAWVNWQLWRSHQQYELVEYAVEPYKAIEIIQGRKSVLYTDTLPHSIFRYQIKPNQIRKRISGSQQAPMPDSIFFKGKLLAPNK